MGRFLGVGVLLCIAVACSGGLQPRTPGEPPPQVLAAVAQDEGQDVMVQCGGAIFPASVQAGEAATGGSIGSRVRGAGRDP
jgi:hypothetical protein